MVDTEVTVETESLNISIKEIKEILKDYYYSDEDLQIILDYSDDFTIEKMKEDPNEFIHNMEKYLDIKKMDSILNKTEDTKNKHERIFDIILSAKGFSNKDIEVLYENKAIPSYDDDNIMEECYYTHIREYLEEEYDEDYFISDLAEYYEVNEDFMGHIYYAFDKNYDWKIDYLLERVVYELNKLGFDKERIKKLEEYYYSEDIDVEYLSIDEIIEETAKIDKFYEEHPDGSYCYDIDEDGEYIGDADDEEEEYSDDEEEVEYSDDEEEVEYSDDDEITSKKTYKDLFNDLTDEQIDTLVRYSDDFTIKKAKEDPKYFIENINKYINPNCLLIDDELSRQKLFELIMTKKGYSDYEIKKLIADNDSPLVKDQIDILLDSYYEKTRIKYGKFNYSKTKKINSRYDYYDCDSFALLGNQIFSRLIDNSGKNPYEPIFYLDPERIEYELKEYGFDETRINVLVLATELGYFDATNNIIYNLTQLYDIIDQQYKRYRSLSEKDGETIAMFLLLSGNIMGNAEDIRATLKEEDTKESLVNIHNSFNFDYHLISIKKAKEFYKEYSRKRESKLINSLQKKYKNLNVIDIMKMVEDTRKTFIYKAPAIKVYKEFNEQFGALTKTNKIKFKLAASSLVTTLGGAVSLGVIGLTVNPHLRELLSSNISLQKITSPNSIIFGTAYGVIFLVGGSAFVIRNVFDSIKNKKEVNEIVDEYNLKIR